MVKKNIFQTFGKYWQIKKKEYVVIFEIFEKLSFCLKRNWETVVKSIKLEKLSFYLKKLGKCREINKIEKLSFCKNKLGKCLVESLSVENLSFDIENMSYWEKIVLGICRWESVG